MTNLNDLTLAEVNQQIELLEVVEQFGSRVQEFTDWLSAFSGGQAVNWASDDATVQHVLGGLKDAAFEFSETLGGFAENFEPLTDAASAAGDINTAVQMASAIATAIGDADEAVSADKAGQLAGILSSLTALSQLLTGLSLNPVIGVLIGLYSTALQGAMVSIQAIADQVAIRDEIVASSTAGIDVAAELAAQEAAADAAAAAELAFSEELSRLYALRSELIAALQGSQYAAALDFAASRDLEAMRELIRIASEQGGITSDAAINGATLGAIESWIGSATAAESDLMMEAAAAPAGSDARQQAIGRLSDLNEARHQVIQGLGPLRESVKGALNKYGYSTADPVPQASVPQAAGTGAAIAGLSRRAVMIGGGGIFALAMVGLVLILPGGGNDDGARPGDRGGSFSSGSSSAGSGTTPAAGGGSSSRAPAPLVIQPCLVIDQARAASLMGTATGPVGVREEEFDKSCGYAQIAGADAGVGIGIFMTMRLNSAAHSSVMRAWQSSLASNYDLIEVRDIPWSELGELRTGIQPVGDQYASASLLAYVITSDRLGRDVYVKLFATGPLGAEASLAAILETIAEELRDGVRAAQP